MKFRILPDHEMLSHQSAVGLATLPLQDRRKPPNADTVPHSTPLLIRSCVPPARVMPPQCRAPTDQRSAPVPMRGVVSVPAPVVPPALLGGRLCAGTGPCLEAIACRRRIRQL
jgi:hypothetical protein